MLEPAARLELGDLLEALITVGQLDEADGIITTWEERAAALDRAWALATLARARGLLLAAQGDLEGAFASFERALAEHARSTDPFHQARTMLAVGPDAATREEAGRRARDARGRSPPSNASARHSRPSKHAPSSPASAAAHSRATD
jgi:hypothetical protein